MKSKIQHSKDISKWPITFLLSFSWVNYRLALIPYLSFVKFFGGWVGGGISKCLFSCSSESEKKQVMGSKLCLEKEKKLSVTTQFMQV